ncbi:hypothetical protein [Micromonospora sp. DT47]|uniref:hypothetical protein n=1 Tax=Micromonospora sp. DT47 TaxID=3393431 RepID=UPI003CF1124B
MVHRRDRRRVREVVADVDPTNPASVRVLDKAGLHRSGTDGHSARADGPVDRYAITAAELSRR